MEEIIKALQDKLGQIQNTLNEFNQEFKKNYSNKTKAAEASFLNYANQIIASKKELEDLENKKTSVVNDTLKLVQEAKAQMKLERDNFEKIMEQEQERLQSAYKKFEDSKADYDGMKEEAIRLHNENKAINEELKEKLANIKKLEDNLIEKEKAASNLISLNQQERAFQDNARKKIDESLKSIDANEKDLAKQQQVLVETSNAQIAKEKELEERKKDIVGTINSLNKKEKELNKKEGELVVEQENIDKQKEVITRDRSDLAAKEANLKQLELELMNRK